METNLWGEKPEYCTQAFWDAIRNSNYGKATEAKMLLKAFLTLPACSPVYDKGLVDYTAPTFVPPVTRYSKFVETGRWSEENDTPGPDQVLKLWEVIVRTTSCMTPDCPRTYQISEHVVCEAWYYALEWNLGKVLLDDYNADQYDLTKGEYVHSDDDLPF